jgi:hypothetical protein
MHFIGVYDKRTTSLAHKSFRSCNEGRPFTETTRKKASRFRSKKSICVHVHSTRCFDFKSKRFHQYPYREMVCRGVPPPNSPRAIEKWKLSLGDSRGVRIQTMERNTALSGVRLGFGSRPPPPSFPQTPILLHPPTLMGELNYY